MEDQLEATSRGRDEALKQLRKIQVSKNFDSLLLKPCFNLNDEILKETKHF